MSSLIFGKDSTQNIVSCEVDGSNIEIFIETPEGVSSYFIPNKYWIVSDRTIGSGWEQLKGQGYYKYIKYYTDEPLWSKERNYFKKKADIFSVYDAKEAAMLLNGFTYYKGMKVSDVSTLAFDIESTGLLHNKDSKVLLISNTYTKNGIKERKLFSYDEYNNDKEFLEAWCAWVCEKDPSVIMGYNIFAYDLPYIQFCADKVDADLSLGRNGTTVKYNRYESEFRKDGSQSYNYTRCYIYGREIVDNMFLAYHYDQATRKYESYRLKQIIKQEGLEVKDRQHYDASTIAKNYVIPEEWQKIKQYAIHDSDDADALYKLQIPAYFYLTQSIPKSFQSINYTASGSQINAFLIRSYLQDGQALPKASPPVEFEGATSFGHPGVYKNVYKIDVASLYPSIMLQYEVCDVIKDPKRNFSAMVSYFTDERLRNKKLAKETGDKYYKDLQEAQKIVINSAYGMLGAPGLIFNSPKNAALVTQKGREVLQTCIDWCISMGFTVVNGDTDSVSITFDGQYLTDEERRDILNRVNELYPPKIHFEDDGYYKTVIVVRVKNYILQDQNGKIKIKGSALKATMKEPALKEFIKNVVDLLLEDKREEVVALYHKYVKEIFSITEMARWVSKKTVTEKVLDAERTNEQKVLDAIEDTDYTIGDKILVYFNKEKELKLLEKWNNDHDEPTLLGKLYKTTLIFENVIAKDKFKNYSLKRKNQSELKELLNGT